MRIPISKLYRAFSELDRFSDEQCERFLRRVQVSSSAQFAIALTAGVAFLATAIAVAVVSTVLEIPALVERLWSIGGVVYWLVMLPSVPALSALLCRDLSLRHYLLREIRLRIARVRCPGCAYILIGLAPRHGMVHCPECGRTIRLEAIGLAPGDLLPPEEE